MNILIVSSTQAEIEQFYSFIEYPLQINENFSKCQFLGNDLSILISGIGSYSMLYNLLKVFCENKYDLIINVGIAGAYNLNLRLGEVIFVKTEQIGDLAINNNGKIETVFETNLIHKNSLPFTEGILKNSESKYYNFSQNLRLVNGLTLNTVSGEDWQNQYYSTKFNVDIETMEGAAFFYACMNQKIDFVEMRGISNYVGKRDKKTWQMQQAIDNLNRELKFFLLEILK